MDILDWVDTVLVVWTSTYYKRFRGHEDCIGGKGADWEGAIITQERYDSKSRTTKFIPVLFSKEDADSIPEPLRSGTHYLLTSEEVYEGLQDAIQKQAGTEPAPLGQPRINLRSMASPLTFKDSPAPSERKYDIGAVDRYAPEKLIGREAELKMLDDAWEKVSSKAPGRPCSKASA